MKFVKALNQGIVTDLGLGGHQYSITMEGTEVPDDVAAKLKDVFGHLVEVTSVGEEVAPAEVPLEEAEIIPDTVTASATDSSIQNVEATAAPVEAAPTEEVDPTLEDQVQA